MDVRDLIRAASDLDLPSAVAAIGATVAEVAAAAARAPHVMTGATRAELDAIHAEALAAADRLDAKLAEAERR